MDDVVAGVRRLTLPLPMKPGHVHCYLLRGSDGWTLVDTGLATPEAEERWAGVESRLDAPLVRIFVTHMHPDHVGGAADASAMTGAGVFQGEHDYEHTLAVWGRDDWPAETEAWFVAHG